MAKPSNYKPVLSTAILLPVIFSGSLAMNSTMASETSRLSAEQNIWSFNIPSQPLSQALQQLNEQTKIQYFFSDGQVAAVRSSGLQGEYNGQQALARLLEDTGYGYRFTDSGTVVVYELSGDSGETQKSSDGKIRDDSGKHNAIEEMIVTAAKRSQNIQDTPMAITAIGNEAIEKLGLSGYDDYLRSVPGISYQERGTARNQIIIRGITSNPSSEDSASGAYFGDIPVTGMGVTANDGSAGSVDIQLVDIERIEVLRGPQGTLYGAGSMSGLVRTIPNKPDLTDIEGRVAGTLSGTDGGGLNSMAQLIANVPLVENKFAIRAVVYRYDNSGYVDNVIQSQPVPWLEEALSQGAVVGDRDNVGSVETRGQRIAARWLPSDNLDVTLTYMKQEQTQDGFPYVELGLDGKYQQARVNVGKGGGQYEFLTQEFEIINLAADYDLGWGVVTGSSTYIENNAYSAMDYTTSNYFYSSWAVPESGLNGRDPQDSAVHELRLASEFDGPFQFLVGIYADDSNKPYKHTAGYSGNPEMEPDGTRDAYGDYNRNSKQQAAFGELSYTLADQITATVGIRAYSYEQVYPQLFYWNGSKIVDRTYTSDKSGNTKKFSLDWRANDDLLLYGLYAEGFRVGQLTNANTLAFGEPLCDLNNDGILDDLGFSIPEQPDSDNTDNFEFGIKSSMLDGKLSVNVATYLIKWQGIPVRVPLASCPNSALVNAGESEAKGFELDSLAYLTDNLKLNMSVFYGTSKLTQDAPGIGPSGSDLPGSADFTASAGLEYGFEFAGWPAFARIDFNHVGEYYSNVPKTGLAAGGYNTVNLKSGFQFGGLNLDVFVKNLTNADALTWVEQLWIETGTGTRANRLRPRTIGVNIGYNF